MSVAVPLFTYAASVNHKGDHTIKETTLGNQATEAPYNATAVPFSEADLVRVGELRCDKMRTREGGSAVPGRVRTQRLTVTNGAWDGSGYTTNQVTFNGTVNGEGNAALYVQGGGANVVGGLRVSGASNLAGIVTLDDKLQITGTSPYINGGGSGVAIKYNENDRLLCGTLGVGVTGTLFTSAIEGPTNGLSIANTSIVDSGSVSSGLSLRNNGTERLLCGTVGVGITGRLIVSTLTGDGNRAVYSDAQGYLTNSSSDSRLKENVASMSGILPLLLQLNPVSFTWKNTSSGGSKTDYGLIAQEVQGVFPSLVFENADGFLGVNYDRLISLSLKAIQELSQEVQTLKDQVAALAS